MNKTTAALSHLLVDALTEGEAEAPTALLQALRAQPHPFVNEFQSGALGEAAVTSFPFATWLSHDIPMPESDETRPLYVKRLRWLLQTLPRWSASSDNTRAQLACMLFTAQRCGGRESLWELLPDTATPSAEFLEEAERLLAECTVDVGLTDGMNSSIWERELLEQFERDDHAGRWDEVAIVWWRLADRQWPNLFVYECARCLMRYAIPTLAKVIDAQPGVLAVMAIASGLSIGQRLHLAQHSTSKRVSFCMVLSVVEKLGRTGTLAAADQDLLVDALCHAMQDASEWSLWMRAFNRYPVRHPPLQAALGQALASAPPYALRAYVEAISLNSLTITASATRDGRDEVGQCLRTFVIHAPLEQRQHLWRHAFDRWHAWRTKESNQDSGQFTVQWSELDYAVASYAKECMSADARTAALDALRQAVSEVVDAWHESPTALITQVNKLFSLFQPYAHAHLAEPDDDMLPTNQIYWPFDLTKNPYLRQLFHIREPRTPLGAE